MKISANEIADTELLGMLEGREIKLVKLKGGLNLAIGSDSKGAESVLFAGSHPAIVAYNMEKAYPSFQSALLKSELKDASKADRHSHFLSDDLRKSGHDIFSIQNGNDVEFYVTKHDLKVGIAKAHIENNELVFGSFDSKLGSFQKGLSQAVSEKALSCGIKKVRME